MNLDEQTVCNPDLGCGLVAGCGPSGAGARPGFGWFFGGDAAINSLAMAGAGSGRPPPTACASSRSTSARDGKIPHEISQSAGVIPWFEDYPYAYYHADTTPFWIARAVAAVARERRPRAPRRAVAGGGGRRGPSACRTTADGDGIMENTTAGLGAIEVGEIGEDIHQDVLPRRRLDARGRGDGARWPRARGEGDARGAGDGASRRRSRASLESRYWIEAAGSPRVRHPEGRRHERHAHGVAGHRRRVRAARPRPRRADARGARGPRACTADWGARMLDDGEPALRPHALQHGRRLAVRHRLPRPRAVRVRPAVGRVPAGGRARPPRHRLVARALARAAVRLALPAARHRRAAAVLRRVDARELRSSPVSSAGSRTRRALGRGSRRSCRRSGEHFRRERPARRRVASRPRRSSARPFDATLRLEPARGTPSLALAVAPSVPPGARDVRARVDGRPAPRSADGAVSVRLDRPRAYVVDVAAGRGASRSSRRSWTSSRGSRTAACASCASAPSRRAGGSSSRGQRAPRPRCACAASGHRGRRAPRSRRPGSRATRPRPRSCFPRGASRSPRAEVILRR